jgi:4a-hydroxytetrahydrobiopterin dehydratase
MSLLSEQEIQDHLSSLSGWELQGNALVKTVKARSFVNAFLHMAAIAQLAEAAGHHPDLNLHDYRLLTVTLSTHSAGGVTMQDLDLARQIDQIPQVS